MAEFEYNDEQLQQLFAEMEPKRRRQALRSSMRKTANIVRRRAIQNLRNTGVHVNKEMEKAIRALVLKRVTGFRVTMGSKRSKNKKTSASRPAKPWEMIDIWLEKGTPQRFTRDKGTRRTFATRLRRAHPTGCIEQYSWMTKTKRDIKEYVTEDMHDILRKEVVRIAEKYGCRT